MGFVANAYSATESSNNIVIVVTAIVMVFYVVAYIVVAVLERRKLSRVNLSHFLNPVSLEGNYWFIISRIVFKILHAFSLLVP